MISKIAELWDFWRIHSERKFWVKNLKNQISKNIYQTILQVGSLTLLIFPLSSHPWFSRNCDFFFFDKFVPRKKIQILTNLKLAIFCGSPSSIGIYRLVKKFLKRRNLKFCTIKSPSVLFKIFVNFPTREKRHRWQSLYGEFEWKFQKPKTQEECFNQPWKLNDWSSGILHFQMKSNFRPSNFWKKFGDVFFLTYEKTEVFQETRLSKERISRNKDNRILWN